MDNERARSHDLSANSGYEASPTESLPFDEAFAVHRRQIDSVLPTGNQSAIKRLYVELGELLEAAAGEDERGVPVLSFPETAPVVLELMSGVRGRILDAGCGPNPALSIALGSERGRRIVGIDIALGTVRLARQLARTAGVDFSGLVADVEALPFLDGSFDACVCEDTIEHVPDDAGAIDELARVLRPGGVALLGTPNRWRIDVVAAKLRDLARARRVPRAHYYAEPSHLREYTWQSFGTLVRPRLRIDKRATAGWTEGRWPALANRLTRMWPFRWVGRMLIVRAQPIKGAEH